MNPANQITVSDMPNEDMKLVANFCGIETAIKLLANLGGISITIPKRAGKAFMERYIKASYNGNNVKEIALKTKTSERYVRRVLRESLGGKG